MFRDAETVFVLIKEYVTKCNRVAFFYFQITMERNELYQALNSLQMFVFFASTLNKKIAEKIKYCLILQR